MKGFTSFDIFRHDIKCLLTLFDFLCAFLCFLNVFFNLYVQGFVRMPSLVEFDIECQDQAMSTTIWWCKPPFAGVDFV